MDPDDPRLTACWAAKSTSIWAMVMSTCGMTNPRLIKVSMALWEDLRAINLHSVRASGFVDIYSDSLCPIVRTVP